MALQGGGTIYMSQIHGEFGWGYNLAAYRGGLNYRYAGAWAVINCNYGDWNGIPTNAYYYGYPSYFSGGTISMAEFFSRSPDNEWDCNCVCACNCNCDCNCCFPSGTKVLMADGTLKNIEDIVVGDYVQGATFINKVTRVIPTRLGKQKLMSFNTRDLFWSESHAFWTKKGDKEWWASYNPEKWIKGMETVSLIDGKKRGLIDNSTMRTFENVKFANVDEVWSYRIVEEIIPEEQATDLPLYFFTVDGDTTMIVNGYVASAGINQYAYSYNNLNWEKDGIHSKKTI